VYFNVNCNVLFKLIKVHLLVSENSTYIKMYGATIKKKHSTQSYTKNAALLHF